MVDRDPSSAKGADELRPALRTPLSQRCPELKLASTPQEAASEALPTGRERRPDRASVSLAKAAELTLQVLSVPGTERFRVLKLHRQHFVHMPDAGPSKACAKPIIAIPDQSVAGIEVADLRVEGAAPENRRLADRGNMRVVGEIEVG